VAQGANPGHRRQADVLPVQGSAGFLRHTQGARDRARDLQLRTADPAAASLARLREHRGGVPVLGRRAREQDAGALGGLGLRPGGRQPGPGLRLRLGTDGTSPRPLREVLRDMGDRHKGGVHLLVQTAPEPPFPFRHDDYDPALAVRRQVLQPHLLCVRLYSHRRSGRGVAAGASADSRPGREIADHPFTTITRSSCSTGRAGIARWRSE